MLTIPSQPIAIPQVRQSQQKPLSTPTASSSLRWSLSLPTPRSSLITDEGNKELSAFSKNLTTYIQQWIHFSPGLKEPVKQKLAANVNIFGYQFLKISGEGNCFFEAVLNQLIDDTNFSNFTAQTLLNTMINHIIKYENNYQNHITDDLGKFIKELQQNPSQIGIVFIMALSRALKINIAIIQSDNEDPIIIKQNNSIKTILLCCGFNRYCPLLLDSTKNKGKDLDTLINQVEPDEFGLSVEPQQTANLVL